MQRRVERQIIKQKRLVTAYKASEQTDEYRAAKIKLTRLNSKYNAFSEAAKLPLQWERTKVLYDR
nr:MAG TPA: minor capsid protein [Caudoviricetes sp.]